MNTSGFSSCIHFLRLQVILYWYLFEIHRLVLWRDNISRKLENLFHWARRILWTALLHMATMVAKEDWWTMLSNTSKPTEELIPRAATHTRAWWVCVKSYLSLIEFVLPQIHTRFLYMAPPFEWLIFWPPLPDWFDWLIGAYAYYLSKVMVYALRAERPLNSTRLI